MNETLMTFREAALMCGVSKSTIERKAKDGLLAGVARVDPDDPTSAWMVPMDSLFDAGLTAEQRAAVPRARSDAAVEQLEVAIGLRDAPAGGHHTPEVTATAAGIEVQLLALKLENAERRAAELEEQLAEAKVREARQWELLTQLQLTAGSAEKPAAVSPSEAAGGDLGDQGAGTSPRKWRFFNSRAR